MVYENDRYKVPKRYLRMPISKLRRLDLVMKGASVQVGFGAVISVLRHRFFYA